MATNTNPPVHIDPSVEDSQKWAFVNQNFQSIANTLSQNSFVIAKTGTATVTAALGTTHNSNDSLGNPIQHGLGYTPFVIARVSPPVATKGLSVPLPYLANPSSATTITYAFINNVDNVSIEFDVSLGAAASASFVGVWTFTYVMLQSTLPI